ncbi:MAG: RNA methyltransferase [Verrucomicrobia bacterium]|nr:RNA methyltransferase [Verrucomicrobiota bacterium]
MLHVHPIDALDRPELAPYRTMRRQLEHREQRILVAEGVKVTQRLLESECTVVSVLLTPEWLQQLEPLLRRRREDMAVFVAPKAAMQNLTGFSMYQGVLAVGRIPPAPTLARLIAQTAAPRLFAAVDGLSSAENLGGLVRNAVAFGAHGLLVGETSVSPYLRRAVRSSMGAIFQLPVIEVSNLAETLHELRAQSIRCLAAHPHTDRRTIFQTDLTGDCCLVFGSEGYGLSAPVLEASDEAVAIPIAPTVDSLNVGSASAIFFCEARRQRGRT